MKALLAGLLLVAALAAGIDAQDQYFPPDVRTVQVDGGAQNQWFPLDVRSA